MFKDYSAKPAALRGLWCHLGTSIRHQNDYPIGEVLEQRNGRWGFDTDVADEKAGLKGLSEADESLLLGCGHVNCPHCGIHLSNGIGDFDGMVERHGEAEAWKLQKHEWACLGCGGEWGTEIAKPGKSTSSRTNTESEPRMKGEGTDRSIPRNVQNGVEEPRVGSVCRKLWDIFDALRDASAADRKAAALAAGFKPSTFAVNQSLWRKYNGLTKGT